MVVIYLCLVRQVCEVDMEVEDVPGEAGCGAVDSKCWDQEDSHSMVDRANVD